ncbi:MAG: acyl-CoA thioesterase [Desulfovibrionales bacterium]
MARLRIDLPGHFPFTTSLRVRVTDLNYGGHLGNDAALGLLHEARVRFLDSYGFSEQDAGGVGLIMADAGIVYRSEGFLGDALTVEIAPSDLSRSGFDLLYRITNADSGAEVLRARTGMIFFDYGSRRIVRAPESFTSRVFPQTL